MEFQSIDTVPRVNGILMNLNLPLRIVKTEDRGRIAVSAEDLQKGTLVLVNKALGLSISKPGSMTVCDRCSKGSPDILNFCCDDCRSVYYCSSECKTEAQMCHEIECRIMKKIDALSETLPAYEFQMLKLVVRLLNIRSCESKNIQIYLDGMIYKDAMDLQSHLEDFPDEKVETFRKIVEYLFTLKEEEDILDVSKEEILSLLYKTECNAYGLWGLPEDGGIGLYPLASYFNHSCAPNLVRFEDGGILSYRTAYDIPKGTELNITYTDIDQPRSDRQKMLQENFFFTCGCDRCNGEKNDETTFKMPSLCPRPDCQGSYQIGSSFCSHCKLKRVGSRCYIIPHN